MKTSRIILLLFILALMIFVICIPAIQEREYAKTHPEFLEHVYDLRYAKLGDTTVINH